METADGICRDIQTQGVIYRLSALRGGYEEKREREILQIWMKRKPKVTMKRVPWEERN